MPDRPNDDQLSTVLNRMGRGMARAVGIHIPPPPPAPPPAPDTGPRPIKGKPVMVFQAQGVNAVSDVAVDMRGYNAASIAVIANGTSPSCTLTARGADEPSGNYLTLPDSKATQTAVTSNRRYDVVCGAAWLRLELSAISGTFGNNTGFTVVVTPYRSPGQESAEIADGDDVALGTTTDAPEDVVENDTARTNISLLKGIKNYLRTLVAGITATVSGTVTSNQGTPTGGDPWPISAGNDQIVALGALGDEPSTNEESATGRSVISLLKGIKNYLRARLPTALAAGGGMKVEGVEGGVAQPVSIDQTMPGTTDRVTVGGTTVIAQTPTITAGAYVAKDAVGGKLTFASAARVAEGGGVIQSVVIVDDAAQSAELVLVLYGADFTATADNAPFDPSDADNENLIGHVKVAATDYQAFADNAVATKTSVGLAFKLAAGQAIYGQLMCTGTPTYVAVGDLTIKLGILQQD